MSFSLLRLNQNRLFRVSAFILVFSALAIGATGCSGASGTEGEETPQHEEAEKKPEREPDLNQIVKDDTKKAEELSSETDDSSSGSTTARSSVTHSVEDSTEKTENKATATGVKGMLSKVAAKLGLANTTDSEVVVQNPLLKLLAERAAKEAAQKTARQEAEKLAAIEAIAALDAKSKLADIDAIADQMGLPPSLTEQKGLARGADLVANTTSTVPTRDMFKKPRETVTYSKTIETSQVSTTPAPAAPKTELSAQSVTEIETGAPRNLTTKAKDQDFSANPLAQKAPVTPPNEVKTDVAHHALETRGDEASVFSNPLMQKALAKETARKQAEAADAKAETKTTSVASATHESTLVTTVKAETESTLVTTVKVETESTLITTVKAETESTLVTTVSAVHEPSVVEYTPAPVSDSTVNPLDAAIDEVKANAGLLPLPESPPTRRESTSTTESEELEKFLEVELKEVAKRLSETRGAPLAANLDQAVEEHQAGTVGLPFPSQVAELVEESGSEEHDDIAAQFEGLSVPIASNGSGQTDNLEAEFEEQSTVLPIATKKGTLEYRIGFQTENKRINPLKYAAVSICLSDLEKRAADAGVKIKIKHKIRYNFKNEQKYHMLNLVEGKQQLASENKVYFETARVTGIVKKTDALCEQIYEKSGLAKLF